MKITDKITITNEDNMALMARYPDKYFDLAIVDPPYGINAANMTMGSGNHKFIKGKSWDSNIPNDEYFNELFRVSKNQIIWGGNYFPLPLNNNWIIWDKLNPNRSFSEAEMAWCSIKNNTRIFKRLSTLPDIDGTKRHITQKPVALYKWLLDKYAKQGDKILDTHLGSGSIAIACHDYGFELTGCELDKHYYDAAIARIKRHTAQLSLFRPQDFF
ncbi:site-specific DNA-methyltransferase (adenine-specific) [Cruoricaptor ignavus]|uniref:Methyltransferase n=1 Tax=Cruoricaptor ignavus TaxID=1118202 RepID=A0A1M6G9E9_9FLAO|nr:DNA methyltransferase [Cruoricaptor ignavus]SHJ06600.1 site-specific DNA-methyltransferase (adenine-specific) [Cruoricaptor ignavus]